MSLGSLATFFQRGSLRVSQDRRGLHLRARCESSRREWRMGELLLGGICGLLLVLSLVQPAAAAFIGWQTFSNCGADNNSGVCDATPDSNSTHDLTPVGMIGSEQTYLSGVIGLEASAAGRKGRGQNWNSDFLNGDGFGNEAGDATRLLVNIPLADGSAGARIGPFGSSTRGASDGTSSWKFSTSDVGRTGDLQITNESDYYFRIQKLHYDARVGNDNSPSVLDVVYLSGDGTSVDNQLIRFDNGSELVDLRVIGGKVFSDSGPVTYNVSQSLGEALDTQVYLGPGSSAGFRFIWSQAATDYAESQLDNIAFEGQFFETADLLLEVDPVVVPENVTVYYVSSSLGSDSNDGLSEASPFQTLGKVNGLDLEPGFRVLFKSGDTWEGMLWPKGSGTPFSPIEISSYGGVEKPLIDGDGYQASVLIFNEDHYAISNLELTNQASYLDDDGVGKSAAGFGGIENDYGTGRNVRFGIKVVANTRSLSGFSFSDLTIRDIYPSPTNSAHIYKGYGIKFESQSDLGLGTIYHISDVSLDSLFVTRTGHYGVWIKPLGLDGSDEHKHDDFTLRNSSFIDTGGSGFVIVKASNVLVENNVFDGTGSRIDDRMYRRGSGLWPFDASDVLIQNNVLRNARGVLDSYGVHIDYNNENVLVQYNYSYNNEGGFAQILGGNTNVGYRYNISVGDGYRVEGVDGAIQNGRIFNVSNYCNVNAGCPSVGNFIYNNTIYIPNTFNPEIYFKPGSGETSLKNNLLVVEEGGGIINTFLASSGVSYDINANLFYPQAAFALDPRLQSGALYVDPRLRLSGADDPAMYKLLSDSPAKSSGAQVAGTLDFFGFPVDSNSAPHVGAYNGNEIFEVTAVPALGGTAIALTGLLLSLFGFRSMKG